MKPVKRRRSVRYKLSSGILVEMEDKAEGRVGVPKLAVINQRKISSRRRRLPRAYSAKSKGHTMVHDRPETIAQIMRREVRLDAEMAGERLFQRPSPRQIISGTAPVAAEQSDNARSHQRRYSPVAGMSSGG